MENIQRLIKKTDVIEHLSDVIMDRKVYKELGEPLIYDDGDMWMINVKYNTVVAFICINNGKLKYLYTKEKYRKNGYAKELLSEMDKYCIKNNVKSIRLVSTNEGLQMYLNHGFEITKSFKNYHNLIKSYELI
jgi:ribosomal protein S18 acetylase RimI-like enzyme